MGRWRLEVGGWRLEVWVWVWAVEWDVVGKVRVSGVMWDSCGGSEVGKMVGREFEMGNQVG